MSNKVYEFVTQKIIEKLETAIANGTSAPWVKPWYSLPPVNYITQKSYRGVNLWLLDDGEYLTWNQLCDLQKQRPELKLRKGSKSNMVVYFSFTKHTKEKVNHTTGELEEKEIHAPFLRYYNVFNINDVDGLESKRQTVHYEHKPSEEAERIVTEYISRENITLNYNNGSRAFYSPLSDSINVPYRELYANGSEYYSTLFHELSHSTGNTKRLNRIKNTVFFGNESYSKEELVAEISAAILCNSVGIDNPEATNNSVAYLQSWLQALKNDVTLIVSASAKAQRAVDYILNVKAEENVNT